MGIIYNIIKSDQNQKKAYEKNLKSFHALGEAQLKQNEQEKKTRAAIEKCAKRKKALLATSVQDFVKLYQKIGKLKYVETDGMRELELIGKNEIASIKENLQIMSSAQILTDRQEKWILLSGWLVGGLSGGLVGGLGGATASLAYIIRKESEQEMASARMIQKEAAVLEAQYNSIALADEIIYERVTRITDILTNVNLLLMKSNKICSQIIETRGNDFRTYTSFEKDCITSYVISAKTLKEIIDIPIFEKDGKLSEKSNDLIALGSNYIKKLQEII